MSDDELMRRRIAALGFTPEQWGELMSNVAHAEPVEAPPDDKPGLITGHTDGSVWRNDEHGVAHEVEPPYAERPDAEVHFLGRVDDGSFEIRGMSIAERPPEYGPAMGELMQRVVDAANEHGTATLSSQEFEEAALEDAPTPDNVRELRAEGRDDA